MLYTPAACGTWHYTLICFHYTPIAACTTLSSASGSKPCKVRGVQRRPHTSTRARPASTRAASRPSPRDPRRASTSAAGPPARPQLHTPCPTGCRAATARPRASTTARHLDEAPHEAPRHAIAACLARVPTSPPSAQSRARARAFEARAYPTVKSPGPAGSGRHVLGRPRAPGGPRRGGRARRVAPRQSRGPAAAASEYKCLQFELNSNLDSNSRQSRGPAAAAPSARRLTRAPARQDHPSHRVPSQVVRIIIEPSPSSPSSASYRLTRMAKVACESSGCNA
jgi:hypothetical protein